VQVGRRRARASCARTDGESIAVLGAGPVGQFDDRECRAAGAEQVIAIDRYDYRPADGPHERRRELTGGRGPERSSTRSGSLQTTALPRLIGIDGTRAAWQIRAAGAIHVGYSTITGYPLGIVKLLPHRNVHTGGRAIVRAAA